jgi:hypothetical protein
MHPVTSAKSGPSWAVRADFHYSLSPLYLLAWVSLAISLCKYNQHVRSGSCTFMAFFTLVGCHFSLFFGAEVEGILFCLGATMTFGWDDFSMHCVYLVAMITYCAAFFASAGVVNSSCLSKISSAVSISSSIIVVIYGAAVFLVGLVGEKAVVVY